MIIRSWSTTVALIGVLGTILLFAAFQTILLLFNADSGFISISVQLAIVCLLAFFVALVIAKLVRSRHQRVIALLAAQLAQVRNNPLSNPLAVHGADLIDQKDLAPLLTEMQLLGDCYRKALAEVVLAKEQVERLSDADGRQFRSGMSARLPDTSSRRRMVARLAPNWRWTAATPPLLQFLQCKLGDVLGRPFSECVHPDDVPTVERSLSEALRDGEAHDATFRLIVPYRRGVVRVPSTTADPPESPQPPSEDRYLQGDRYLQMDVMTTYNEGGRPLHLRCHFLDVTDRVLTERELRRRTEELSQANSHLLRSNRDLQRLKESYRDLYHQAPVLYFGLDPDGKFVALNETVLRTLGYQREALLGQPYTKLLSPKSLAAYLGDAAVFQQTCELETQWVKADGSVIDVWVVTTPIKDESGVFVRSRSAAHDVTERKRLANALNRNAEELAEANDKLRRINQELEEFTYVVSHDLKEPLRTLQAFSTFLAQDYGEVLGAEGHDYLNHLIEASRRLGDLIDDLLSLSRAGRVINTPRPFAWEDALRVLLGDLGDLIQRRNAVVLVEGELPPVTGDPERVIQLLSNLVGNALKYNQSPHPEVVIGARKVDHHFATLFVRDNGIGIPHEYYEQIFQMFRRLHRREE
ncbi:MAG TPA: PAS domain S-box protein, partial [Gemmataceae bacterium]|nr:PAS domain S-box protein [Gemmataceae bacterium]